MTSLKEIAAEKRAAEQDKIVNSLIAAGVISQPKKALDGQEAINAVFAYRNGELKRQAEAGSTATAGKFEDPAQRALMHAERGTKMPVYDAKCRWVGKKDIIVPTADGKRLAVEIKTNNGQLATGASPADAWENLLSRVEAGEWIAWAFILPEQEVWGYTPENFAEQDRRVAWIFMRLSTLLDALAEYAPDKGVATWLKETTNAKTGNTAINWQDFSKSSKKQNFLWDLWENKSYDWQYFRATGKFRLVSER